MTRTRRGAVSVLLALSLSVPLMGAASAVPEETSRGTAATAPVAAGVELPRPTGPYAVGLTTLPLTDTGRTDHWKPEAGPRELLVSVHYPARRSGGSKDPGPYLTAEEARLLLEQTATGVLIPGRGPEVVRQLSEARTHARGEARPVRGKFPLVVLSPGFGLPRATMTALAEQLASAGYVVASVDHAYESVATAFPGKGVLPCTACELTESGKVPHSAVAEGRAKDVSFVLDRLTGRDSVWKHARMIDRKRIGMGGHSIGGNSASQTMATDRRVGAGVNMDGSFLAPMPVGGLDGRPFLMLGAADSAPDGGDKTWKEAWERLDGWKRWITVNGSHHFTFVDAPALADQIPGSLEVPGAPSGARSVEITRTYVAAFFDRHLKGTPQRVLNGPTAGNPEVVFHRP